MLEADLNALVTPELLEAFRNMWAVSGDDALAEAGRILEAFAEPHDKTEVERLVAKIVIGLVGKEPNLSSWLEALAVGSFELRPKQDYAYSSELKSRARLLSRQKPMYIGQIEEYRRVWAAEVGEVQDAIRLIAASALAKELRKNIAAKAAIGPGWPIMVAVNDYFSADEKRLLHRFGADARLIQLLATYARSALRRFARSHTEVERSGETHAADWRRSLPPGADARAYFAKKEVERSKPRQPVQTEPPSVVEEILAGPRPAFLIESESSNLPHRIQLLLPEGRMSANRSAHETFSKAMRAVARRRARDELAATGSPFVQSEDFRVQVWLKHWIEQGGGIPDQIPVRYLTYLEEEACLASEMLGDDWAGIRKWRRYGLVGQQSRVRPADLPWDFWDEVETVTWIKPPRKVDRIDVGEAGNKSLDDLAF